MPVRIDAANGAGPALLRKTNSGYMILQQSEHAGMRHATAMLACAIKAAVMVITALTGVVLSSQVRRCAMAVRWYWCH